MKYQQFDPPAHLKAYVRYFWTLESDVPLSDLQHFRTIADGHPGLIFQHADDGRFQQHDKILEDVFLFGQTTRYAEISLAGKFNTVGIFFHPHALHTVFGLESAAFTDSCLGIYELSGKKELSQRLSGAKNVQESIDLLSAFIYAYANRNSSKKNLPMQFALSEIMRTDGNISLVDLRNKLQLSERSFERNFKNFTGITPKLFTRISRFQVSLKQLQVKGYDKLSDIAFENNYADQSHFIRSFNEFAGFSPNSYKKQSEEIVENFSVVK
jgi:AraC-like DNA-binding protein